MVLTGKRHHQDGLTRTPLVEHPHVYYYSAKPFTPTKLGKTHVVRSAWDRETHFLCLQLAAQRQSFQLHSLY